MHALLLMDIDEKYPFYACLEKEYRRRIERSRCFPRALSLRIGPAPRPTNLQENDHDRRLSRAHQGTLRPWAFRRCRSTAQQVAELVELLKAPPAGEEDYLLDLLTEHVPPGVDDAAYVKAAFLADVAERQGQLAADRPQAGPPSCWAP